MHSVPGLPPARHAPFLAALNTRSLRRESNIITISMRIWWFAASLAAVGAAMAQTPEGRFSFQTRCAVCHGTDGNGGEHAPSILARVQRPATTRNWSRCSARACRAWHAGVQRCSGNGDERAGRLSSDAGGAARAGPWRPRFLDADEGPAHGWQDRSKDWRIGRTSREVQLRTDDQRIHLLRKAGERYREVTSQADWSSYHGATQRQSLYAR